MTVSAAETPKSHLFVSNRSPYLHLEQGRELCAGAAIGGLVSTMEPLFRELGGLWIGSRFAPGSTLASGSRTRVSDAPQCFTRAVDLEELQARLYYDGFANGSLWPLCHGLIERFQYSPDEWVAYKAVNVELASAISDELSGADTVVWIHDYHLALAPEYVRAAHPQQDIASFWHVPFPAPEVFAALEPRQELLRGMLHSSFIGFHIQTYAENFLACVAREMPEAVIERRDRWAEVEIDGRRVKVGAVPLGIEYDRWDRWRQAPTYPDEVQSKRADISGDILLLGVDRVDYTKGIVEKIQAIDHLLTRRPDLCERLQLVQIAVPTRLRMDDYRRYRDLAVSEVKRVNGRFETNGWRPIDWREGMMPQKELAPWYAAADIACITPVRDGMNLVAKEFVAARMDDTGALVLSREAGAAHELGDDAFLVDPTPEGIAAGIEKALIADPTEHRRRISAMREVVRKNDLDRWLKTIITSLDRPKRAPRTDPIGAR